jgi:AraC-like DNA-binding protein
METLPNDLTPDKRQRAEQVKNFLISHVQHNYSLKELAKEVNESQNFIKTHFRLAYGEPQHTFIFNFRMELAVAMLKEKHTLKHISLSIGYGEQAAFTKAFKKKYKCTPTQYIAQYIQGKNI